jgi:hypothetical protein
VNFNGYEAAVSPCQHLQADFRPTLHCVEDSILHTLQSSLSQIP